MRIERIPVDKLNPAPYNPRKDLKPGDAKYEHIKNSIDTFGYIDPIIWNKRTGNIVGGHQRFKILKAQGATEIECVIVDYDETTEKAANAALNKAQGDWDMTKLDALLADLSPLMDMGQFGFEINLPHDLVEDDFDANKALEEIEKPVTKLGDIWTLGRHRLMCGDSTDISNVTRLMDGQKSKLLFTSPPYSDMREYNGGKDLSVESIAQFISCYEPFTALQAVNLGIQRKGGEIYPYWNAYIDTAKKVGLKLLAWNVWDKLTCGSVGQQKAMIPIRHEWIFCFGKEPVPVNPTWRKKEASIYSGGRYNKIRQADGSFRIARRGNETGAFKKMESLLELPEQTSLESVTKQLSEKGKIRAEHPDTFPVALPSEYIVAFTDEDDIVVEPFGGSGSTLIACEQLNRSCYMMELDTKYCDVIIKRWETLTGQKAVLNA